MQPQPPTKTAPVQIYTLKKDAQFILVEDTVTRNEDLLEKGTGLSIKKTSSTQWFEVTDGTHTWEISRLTPGIPM